MNSLVKENMPKLSEKLSHTGVRNESGVYALGFVGDPRVYVGSAAKLRERLAAHRWAFRKGVPVNYDVRQALAVYGFGAARFKVLEYCPVGDLEARETFWAAQGPVFNKKAVDRSGIEQQRVSMRKVHAANREVLERDPERVAQLAARKVEYAARQRGTRAKMTASFTAVRLHEKLSKLLAEVADIQRKIKENDKFLTK